MSAAIRLEVTTLGYWRAACVLARVRRGEMHAAGPGPTHYLLQLQAHGPTPRLRQAAAGALMGGNDWHDFNDGSAA